MVQKFKKVLVIIGAGASHDSVNTQNSSAEKKWQPPLVADLFQNRYIRSVHVHPRILGLVSAYQSVSSSKEEHLSLEDYLTSKYNALLRSQVPIDDAPVLFNGLLHTIYYLKDLFHHCSNNYIQSTSNYHALVERLGEISDRVTCITFNYDTLLEKAIKEVRGQSFNTVQEYISKSFYVIKPHGSSNWTYRCQHSIGSDIELEKRIDQIKRLSENVLNVRAHLINASA